MNLPVNYCKPTQLTFPDCPEQHLGVMIYVYSHPDVGDTYNLGETIEFQITVVNDGEIDLENVVVRYGDETITINKLPVGQTWIGYSSHVVTMGDCNAGEYTETVIAYSGAYTVEDSITSPCEYHVAAVLTYEILSTPADGERFNVGEQITLLATLENTGDVELEGITITTTWGGGTHTWADLSPHYSCTTSSSRELLVSDITGDTLIFTATAYIESLDLTLTASVEMPVQCTLIGTWSFTKVITSTPPNSVYEDGVLYEYYVEGDDITYAITFTNSTNMPVHITTEDPMFNLSHTETLYPGTGHTFNRTHTVTADEADASLHEPGYTFENTATCVGSFADGTPVNTSATASFTNYITR